MCIMHIREFYSGRWCLPLTMPNLRGFKTPNSFKLFLSERLLPGTLGRGSHGDAMFLDTVWIYAPVALLGGGAIAMLYFLDVHSLDIFFWGSFGWGCSRGGKFIETIPQRGTSWEAGSPVSGDLMDDGPNQRYNPHHISPSLDLCSVCIPTRTHTNVLQDMTGTFCRSSFMYLSKL